jgi:hypothetical protein
MNWYAFTGVVDGKHYHAILQATSLRAASYLFNDNVVSQIGGETDMSRKDIERDYAEPWVISCTRSETKPERMFLS